MACQVGGAKSGSRRPCVGLACFVTPAASGNKGPTRGRVRGWVLIGGGGH